MFEDVLKSQGLSDEQIAVIVAAKSEEESGLKSKNQELLDKLSKNKSTSNEHESELERLRQLEKNQKISQEEAKHNYDAALKLAEDGHTAALTKASEEAASWKSKFSKVAIDNVLSAELEKAGVTNPALKNGAVAMLRPNISLGDDGNATAGDKSIQDYVKEWSAGETGKAFVTLKNSGGDLKGGQANVSGYEGKKLSDLGSDERKRLFKEQPEVYRALKAKGK